MQLIQSKLDASTKKRSNLFNWRGQFTPEFVEYILKEFAHDSELILDPFSGSGTVLQESALLGKNAVGFEINPAAFAMSKFFKFSSKSFSERLEFVTEMESKLMPISQKMNGKPIYNEDSNYRISYANLIDFSEQVYANVKSEEESIFLLNVLFQSEKDKKLTIQKSIYKSYSYIKDTLMKLPYSDFTVDAFLSDARSLSDKFVGKADLILTSPPYINVFNYHQNHRAVTESFNYDILKVANSEFGSNRKNRGNRFKTAVQYCLDMEQAIKSFWVALKPEAKLILVVGRESSIRSVPFYNSKIIIDILNLTGGFKNMKISERQFTNKFGKTIYEDIIISDKAEKIFMDEIIGDKVAFNHLQESLKTSDSITFLEINSAIESIPSIQSSPLFNVDEIIKLS